MTTTPTCPHCGHPMITAATVLDAFTPSQRFVFDMIERSGRAGVSGPTIYAAMYAGTKNGGPESLSIISAHLVRMRPKLAAIGLSIVSDNKGSRSRYRLETTQPCPITTPSD